MKKYKFCQSCGMPLAKDPQGGGTEANGSKSTMYCSHCYQHGRFTENLTAAEMRIRVRDHMHKSMGFPMFLAKLMSMNVPKLARWKAKS